MKKLLLLLTFGFASLAHAATYIRVCSTVAISRGGHKWVAAEPWMADKTGLEKQAQ